MKRTVGLPQVVVALVTLLSCTGRAQDSPLIYRLSLETFILHHDSGTQYVGTLSGAFTVSLTQAPNSQGIIARLPIDLGDSGPALQVQWFSWPNVTGPPSSTFRAILVRAGAEPKDVEDWKEGKGIEDPGLQIPLVPGQTELGEALVNSSPVSARLLVASCADGGKFEVLGDLLIAQGNLQAYVLFEGRQQHTPPLYVRQASVTAPDRAVWNDLLSCGSQDGSGLPSEPSPGLLLWLRTGPVESFPPSGSDSHRRLAALLDFLSARTEEGALIPWEGLKMVRTLAESDRELHLAETEKALTSLDKFRATLLQEGEKSGLTSQDVMWMETEVRRATESILTSAFNADVVRPPSFCQSLTCLPQRLYVDAQAEANSGDGSADRPFSTISEALEAAAEWKLCGVEVRVAAGEYLEPTLEITRDTTIVGERPGRLDPLFGDLAAFRTPVVRISRGGFHNRGPYRLQISNLSLLDSTSKVDPWYYAAITVDSPCATTLLQNVHIRSPRRHGVLQRGGTLRIDGMEVSDSTSLYAGGGTAIWLREGVEAIIQRTRLYRNGGAMLIEGRETKVLARSVTAEHHKAFPFDTALGAVTAADQALLLMESSSISDNRIAGLLVSGGAKAHFRDGVIRRTTTFAVPDSDLILGGHNVVVENRSGPSAPPSVLELRTFELQDPAVANLVVDLDAWARASDGVMRGGRIGVSFDPERPPAPCLLRDTELVDCERCLDLRSVSFPSVCAPPPDPEDPGDPPPGCGPRDAPVDECPADYRVPFDCTWCVAPPPV